MKTYHKASILIVDDNASLCRTMALILGRKGYAVTTARDGPEAIDRVRQHSFDITFMDIKMPVLDGAEAFKRIKTIRPETVVVMMTAYAVEDLTKEAVQEGAYAIIYKPLDMDKVLALITQVSETRQGALILVVDDDPGTCITLKNILVHKGHQVGIAHSGEEAIVMAQAAVYDIIFIDVKLPALNGLETYLALRQANPHAVAIMITGYRQQVADLVEEALRHNAYTCLYKPLDMAEVLRLLDEIWNRRRGEREIERGRERGDGEGR